MRKAVTFVATAILIAAAGSACAAQIEVKMLNKGADGTAMVFEPALINAQPGDTVKFISTDKGHSVESVKGMMPADAAPFTGKMSQDVTVTFDKPGIYGVKCAPHYGMGMVALVVVGTPTNTAEAKAITHPGKAKATFAILFEKSGAK